MKMRTSLVPMVYVLGLSLVVGVLVLTALPAASGIDTETVNINPETLNLKSKGTWITVDIELPEGYDVEDIDVTTVRVETVPAAWSNVEGNKLMAKFDRQTVINYIWNRLCHMGIVPLPKEGVEVELTITGKLYDGTPFEGSDTIRVIYQG